MLNYKIISLALGAVLLVAAASAASVYWVKRTPEAEKVVAERRESPAPRQAKKCNDNNIAGAAVGGIGGGVLGSLVGRGGGKTAATIGGALGGAYIGSKTIPLQNETCR